MLQQIRAAVADDFAAVDRLIVENLRSDVGLVEEIGEYLVDAGGKRLRPLLVLLAAKACGYEGQEHIRLAAIIEFIHTATLLHDDVVDLSMLRRGRPTANATWGNAPSVLVGDFIYSRAFQLLVSSGNQALMSLLADTTNIIAAGEVLQLMRAGNPDTTEEEQYEVMRRKTAVLFAAASEGAAMLAGNPQWQDALREYGLQLGIAFQLVDDVLDYTGNPEQMGKNVGDDLAEGKPTLPLIAAQRMTTPDICSMIRQALRDKDSSRLAEIVTAVQACGAVDYTRDAAQRAADAAQQALHVLPDSQAKEALALAAQLAVSRLN